MMSLFKRQRRQQEIDSEKLIEDTSQRSHVLLPDNTVGFGVSGGGIRSATIALGVFQALAERHVGDVVFVGRSERLRVASRTRRFVRAARVVGAAASGDDQRRHDDGRAARGPNR